MLQNTITIFPLDTSKIFHNIFECMLPLFFRIYSRFFKLFLKLYKDSSGKNKTVN